MLLLTERVSFMEVLNYSPVFSATNILLGNTASHPGSINN